MRICLVGPTYPYRGGIAHYTTLLAQHLAQDPEHEHLLISFSRQYPSWLYKGTSDRDTSRHPLRTEAEYLLDSLNPLSWRRTWRRIGAWQPDIVVMFWWVPVWAPAWSVLGRAIKRLRPAPRLVYICHNALPHEASRVDRLALRAALSPADGLLAHAKSDAAELRRIFPGKPVAVSPLPTFAGVGRTPAVLPVSLPADRPLLLFCGFVRPYKGLDVLLDALPAVLAQQPVHLLVAGEFWDDEEEYREQIGRLGLEAAVTIDNRYIPDEELSAYLHAADVVVAPYRDATQSAVVQLAFGHGRPVITTDVGGLAEAVEDGRTGLVVPPEDVGALAGAVNRYLNRSLRLEFEQNLLDAQPRFAWPALVETLLRDAGA
ncbi:MAG: glycosyltransferase [Anaerolineae bacterium]|nr:glycosyltransferase [Anaerolineae bacterium]